MTLNDVMLFLLPVCGTPVTVGGAWWLWSKPRVRLPQWRGVLQLVSMLAASVNAAIYYCWFAYRALVGSSPAVWQLKESLGNNVGVYFAVVTLILGVFSIGAIRIVIIAGAVFELLLWSNFGIL